MGTPTSRWELGVGIWGLEMGKAGWRAGSCSTQFRDTQGRMAQREVILGVPGDLRGLELAACTEMSLAGLSLACAVGSRQKVR